MELDFTEISLGKEWIPGLIDQRGAEIRAAILDLTGQSSLPHIFIGGQSIGGLYSGNPGLLALLERGTLRESIEEAVLRQTDRRGAAKSTNVLKRKNKNV